MRVDCRLPYATWIAIAAVGFLATAGETVRGQARYSDRGSASGFVIFKDGKTERKIELKFAYAVYFAAGWGDPSSPWEVLLTDALLPQDAFERGPFLQQLLRDRKLNALWLSITGGGEVRSSVGNCGICNQPPETFDSQAVWWERSKQKESFKPTRLSDRGVAGTARFLPLETGPIGARYRYEVTFTASLRETTVSAIALSRADDEPGRAYLRFYRAIQEQDFETARGLLARDIAGAVADPGTREWLVRSGRLTQRYDQVLFSQIYSGGESAQILVGREVPGEVPVYTHVASTGTVGTKTLPFPIPPICFVFDKTDPESDVAPIMPVITTVRLVPEGGAWKVYWLLDHEHDNVLLKGYRNAEERRRRNARVNSSAFNANSLTLLSAGG